MIVMMSESYLKKKKLLLLLLSLSLWSVCICRSVYANILLHSWKSGKKSVW